MAVGYLSAELTKLLRDPETWERVAKEHVQPLNVFKGLTVIGNRFMPEDVFLIGDPLAPEAAVMVNVERQVYTNTVDLAEAEDNTLTLAKLEEMVAMVEKWSNQLQPGKMYDAGASNWSQLYDAGIKAPSDLTLAKREVEALRNQVIAGAGLLLEKQDQINDLKRSLDRTQKVTEHWMESCHQLGALVDQMRCIVQVLFDTTSDRALYNQCKAALNRYEEVSRDAARRTAQVYGAPAVAAGAGDGRDCAAHGPAGVAGGEPAGPAEARLEDGTGERFVALELFEGFPQQIINDAIICDWADRELKAGRSIPLRRKNIDASSREELFDLMKDFNEQLHHGCERYDRGIFWRTLPEYWSQKNYDTGKISWHFNCSYYIAPKRAIVAYGQHPK
jgi:hypothetical protein